MNTPLRITAFAAVLAAAFGTAYGVGGVADPIRTTVEPAAHAGHDRAGESEEGEPDQRADEDGSAPPSGLQISEGGYSLDLETRSVPAAKESEIRFAVRDSAGRKVTDYRREHGKELHLILASRDTATYRHLHPTRDSGGTWSVDAELPAAGDYRLFADFTPAAKGASDLTLGADLAVSGRYRPASPPSVSKVAEVDGYKVALEGGMRPGVSGRLDLTVTKDGRPVTDLQPYLESYGHLVALRSGDMAYLHVHPNGAPGDGKTKPGPTVSFTATAPSGGTYRLFLDFKHQGKVRTASFTVDAGETSKALAGSSTAEESGEHQH
ncbi:hypothetical protein GCM10010095_61480 [Streptomyces anthocyanicus]|uniref:hypothetical protein n=1 Tax=Streptomyces anthocyanicus TaxID=68174 RepID=UPI001670C580|nr:hypothetical protein [Streptomyces anthocyanicus]GGL68294.1 hypothetical protein GCM10010095_61480 [Streptomyces anthocyanicus]